MNEQTFAQIIAEKLADITDVHMSDTIATTSTVNVSVRCPHCGESYYMENYSTTTCLYCPPIYKDGVNINPDRNTSTVHCTCIHCGKDFSFKR